MTRFSVLGPGGVGGFVAAALARSGEAVSVVARDRTAEVINREGVVVQSVLLGDFVVHPRAVGRLEDAVDVLFVAPKATGLAEALERVEVPPGVVVPLLNGLDHMSVLRERFGPDRVAAGVIRIEAARPVLGRIVHTSPTVRVDLASDRAELAERLPPIAEALRRAGIPVQIGASEAQILWSKLTRLSALSATTTAFDRPIGDIRSDPQQRAMLIRCIEEAAAAANADGAVVDPAATLAELDHAHADLGSSMQRDVRAGRAPELDAIQGSVIRAAARHGLECPVMRALAAVIAERAGVEVVQTGEFVRFGSGLQ